jgi:hypothetical protein
MDVCQDGKIIVDWVIYTRKLEIVYISPKMTKPIDRVLCNQVSVHLPRWQNHCLADGLEQHDH